MKLSDKNCLSLLQEQLMPVFTQISSGVSARDAARDIYMTLDGKTPDIANLMTDNMAEIIESYHSEIEQCQENKDAYIQKQLDEKMQGITSSVQRCEALNRILTAMTSFQLHILGKEEEAEIYEKNNREFTCTENEAPAREAELRSSVLEALKTSQFTASQIPGLLKQIDSAEFEGLQSIVEYGRKSRDLKLILSMQAYVNARNGFYEDISPDVSMEQIIYNVCAAADTAAAASQLKEGKISLEESQNILGTIGQVAGLAGLSLVILGGTGILASLLMSSFHFISLGTALVLSSLVVLPIACQKKNIHFAMENGQKILEKTGIAISSAAGTTIHGLYQIAEWIIPAITRAVQWLKSQVFHGINEIEKTAVCHPGTAGTKNRKPDSFHQEPAEESQPAGNGEKCHAQPEFA